MRILVTGVAGFVGSHLAEQLVAEGHDVVGLDSFTDYYPRAVKERNLTDLHAMERFAFHELDLRTDDLAAILDGIDVVINEAAMAGLMRSWTDLDAYVSCNILGLQRLVEAARAASIRRFIQISTSSVYGSDAVGDEDVATRPVSPYGVTKLAAENLLAAHVAANAFPATVLRYFSIYGPRQRPDMAYHIFTEALIDGRPIVVYGDGLQSRSNTYVADAVRGTIDAIDGAEVGQAYNIGGGEETTLLHAIDIIAGTLGVTPTIHHGPARPGDQRRTWADTTRARRAFRYGPTVSPADGLSEQVQWHQSLREMRSSGA